MHVNKLMPLEVARKELSKSIRLIINKDKTSPEKLAELKPILEKNKGKVPVYLQLNSNGNKDGLYALNKSRVELSNALFSKVQEILGEDSIVLSTK